jgi:hypothetical protein
MFRSFVRYDVPPSPSRRVAHSYLLWGADSCFAQAALRVNEAATPVQIRPDATAVGLVVHNPSHETVSAHVLLQLLDTRGAVTAQADGNFSQDGRGRRSVSSRRFKATGLN